MYQLLSTMQKNNDLGLQRYKLICHSLHAEKIKMLEVKQNLLNLTEKYEITSKSLLRLKTDLELYRSHLCRSLFNQRLTTDKQKKLLRKKLDEFLERKKRNEEYLKVSPIVFELENLIKENDILLEECKKKTNLLKFTEQQYNDLLNKLMRTFKKKVCEFCEFILANHVLVLNNMHQLSVNGNSIN